MGTRTNRLKIFYKKVLQANNKGSDPHSGIMKNQYRARVMTNSKKMGLFTPNMVAMTFSMLLY